MSDKTQLLNLCQQTAIFKSLARSTSGCAYPVVNIIGILGTVTRLTRRDNIPRNGFTALSNRDNVIPCGSGCIAVRTLVLKFLQQHQLCFVRNILNAFASTFIPFRFSVLPNLMILFSIVGVCMIVTQSSTHDCHGLPIITSPTPSQTKLMMFAPLVFSRAGRSPFRPTWDTRSIQPIMTAAIFTKFSTQFPSTTLHTMLQAVSRIRNILVNADTKTIRRNLNCALF